jgi:hypothetical protein
MVWFRIVLVLAMALGLAGSAQGDDANIDELVARMDRLWVERHRPGAMHDMISLGMVALAIDPGSYAAQWRTSRAAFWVARTQSNRVVKGAMAVRAKDLAERAVTLAPQRAEGHYFSAVALGEYATTTGIVRAVREGLAGKIETAALKAYEIDRDFDDGAPIAVLGRFYFVLPWPKRDLAKSRRFLEEGARKHPQILMNFVYLAELEYDEGHPDKAHTALQRVLKPTAPVSRSDEQAEARALARAHLEKWFPEP